MPIFRYLTVFENFNVGMKTNTSKIADFPSRGLSFWRSVTNAEISRDICTKTPPPNPTKSQKHKSGFQLPETSRRFQVLLFNFSRGQNLQKPLPSMSGLCRSRTHWRCTAPEKKNYRTVFFGASHQHRKHIYIYMYVIKEKTIYIYMCIMKYRLY